MRRLLASCCVLASTGCWSEAPGTTDAGAPTEAVALVGEDIACAPVDASPELVAECQRLRAEVNARCHLATTPGDRAWCLARYLESNGGPHLPVPHETITIGRYHGGDRTFTYAGPLDHVRYGTAPRGPWGGPPATTCGWTAFECMTGSTSDDDLQIVRDPDGPFDRGPRAFVNAIGVALRFEYQACAHPHLRLQSATLRGAPPPEGDVQTVGVSHLQIVDRTGPPGDGAFVVDVGHAASAGWALWCDGNPYTETSQGPDGSAYTQRLVVGDPLDLDRPPQLGAFSIPVLPMAIAYAPVQDMAASNVATTTVSSALALELSTYFSDEHSTTTGVTPTLWDAGGAKDVLDLGARVFGASSRTDVKAIGYAFEAAGRLIGTSSATSTESTATTSGDKVTIQYAQSREIESASALGEPGRRLGPGVGDQIIYVPDLRGVWAVTDDRIWLAPTAPPGLGNVAVQDLLLDLRDLAETGCRGARTGFAAADLRTLLSIDPNVAVPASLPCGLTPWVPPALEAGGRFSVVSDQEVVRRGRGDTTFTRTSATCENNASRASTTRVDVYAPGPLQSALGTFSGTLGSRVEHGSRSETCTQEVRSTTIGLHATDSEQYALRVWYDHDFGGFPISPYVAPTGGQPLSNGADRDGDGVPDDRELAQGSNPDAADTDGDGLSDGFEQTLGTSPVVADSDGDGLDDRHDARPWCVACTWTRGPLTITTGTTPVSWTGELVVAPGPTTMIVDGPAAIE